MNGAVLSYDVLYNSVVPSSALACANCVAAGTEYYGNPLLATLGDYGGPTKSMLPLPGGVAICLGSAALVPGGVTTDQRGFARSVTTYGTSCVDLGAVQSNYQSIQFDRASYAGVTNTAVSPAPVVSVTENGESGGGVPVTLTFAGTGTATGVGPVTTVSGVGASFSGLEGDIAGSGDTLAATLQVTNVISPVNYSLSGRATLDVTADLQTITFTLPTAQVNYGAVPIALSASASSGLPVTFTVISGPGVLSGSTLSITGAGTIVVRASQGGQCGIRGGGSSGAEPSGGGRTADGGGERCDAQLWRGQPAVYRCACRFCERRYGGVYGAELFDVGDVEQSGGGVPDHGCAE
jgi:hypothetical protein